jgi:hypothetical protein
MILTKKTDIRGEKPDPVPFCPPWIPLGLARIDPRPLPWDDERPVTNCLMALYVLSWEDLLHTFYIGAMFLAVPTEFRRVKIPVVWECSFLNSSNFHVHTVHLDNYQSFFTPTDAQLNCLKKNLKFTLKLTLKQLLHISVQTPSSGNTLFELANVTVVKIVS